MNKIIVFKKKMKKKFNGCWKMSQINSYRRKAMKMTELKN